jgi:DNA-binding NarL/FixJ family response regulator
MILGLVAEGRTNTEIAAILLIAPSTVKRHLSSAMWKLEARNRQEAVERSRGLELTSS